MSIARLEADPRGVYCGAIGVVRPNGDFTFNVAIRTITVGPDGRAVYGAGGGITADSDPDRELEELFTKTDVLTANPSPPDLIETLRLEDGVLWRLDRHLSRMGRSAGYFGFADSENALVDLRRKLVAEAGRRPKGAHRVRLVLRPDGSNSITIEPFVPATEPRRMGIARTPVDSMDRLLYHKTSSRSGYAERLAEVRGLDDAILVNERGELTETTIGNLVLELDGRLVTPALGCGLLPGIFREELLERREIEARVLYPADLRRCTRLWMINSLRGWVEANAILI